MALTPEELEKVQKGQKSLQEKDGDKTLEEIMKKDPGPQDTD